MVRSVNGSRQDLTEGVVWKKLLVFFLPIAAGTCIQQLYNAVDGMVLSKFVGTEALASVGGSSAQIINVLIGFFVSMTSGASVVIAQIFGAGRKDEVQRACGSAITLCAILGVAIGLIGMPLIPWMLRILKTPDDTVEGAILYLRIYFTGVPFILILNMESNALRAVGDSTGPFLFMVIGCVTNIILDLLFVIVFDWGIAGVAVATVLAQLVNMLLLTLRLMTTRESYRLEWGSFRIGGGYLRPMVRLGVPSGLQSSMYSISNMVIQVGVNMLNTVVVASWAMTSKTDGLYWAISNALGAAITAFIGQNIGAGRMDRVKQCVRQGLLISLIITVVVSAGLMAAAKPLLGILTDDRAVIDTTFEMMTYFVPYYFTWTLIEVYSAVLRGAGDAVRPVIICGVGICLFRIVWMVTLFARFQTLPVLCFSYAASWIVTGVALLLYYRFSDWKERTAKRLTGN